MESSLAARWLGLAAAWALCPSMGCSSGASRAVGDASTAPTGAEEGGAPDSGAEASPAFDGDGAVLPAGDGAASDDAAPGCPGVPIVPDDGGFVATGSNSVGIHGSWFFYSDCVDLGGQNCSAVTSPTGTGFANTGGKMCTSGHTSTATGAWGAGIALELNDGPPQLPYDTTASGISGFCFVLSGPTIPSTTVRVAFPTQDNNDNAYFESVSTPGLHTVLFSSTAQGSWVTVKQAFEPTKVTLIQFQIPSATNAPVAWDFCVEGLTAITQ